AGPSLPPPAAIEEPTPAAQPAAPPPAVTPAPPPAPPSPPRLVRAPGPRRVEVVAGNPVVLEARVDPEGAAVTYRWTVDGRPLAAESSARLAYEPDTEGRHTVAVTADDGQGGIARETWVVAVAAPAPRAPEPPPVAAPAIAPASATSTLAEADVRR